MTSARRSALRALSPLVHRLAAVHRRGSSEIERRIDQRDVRERLGEIAHLTLRPRIILLGEEPDVIAEREQPLEESARVLMAPLQHVVVRKPKAASDEGALAAGKPVVGLLTIVAQHESIDDQSLLDLLNSAPHPRIVRRQE